MTAHQQGSFRESSKLYVRRRGFGTDLRKPNEYESREKTAVSWKKDLVGGLPLNKRVPNNSHSYDE